MYLIINNYKSKSGYKSRREIDIHGTYISADNSNGDLCLEKIWDSYLGGARVARNRLIFVLTERRPKFNFRISGLFRG